MWCVDIGLFQMIENKKYAGYKEQYKGYIFTGGVLSLEKYMMKFKYIHI